MRVLILSDTYSPAPNSCARMLQELGTQLLAFSHDVTILTADASQRARLEICDDCGMTVLRVRTQPVKSLGKVRRALAEIRLSSTYWRAARRYLSDNPCDLIVYYSPTIFLAPLAERLKRMWSCRVYLVLRDVFPDWALEAGVLKSRMLYSYFRRCAKQQFRIADRIGVETESSIDYFNSHYPGREDAVEVLMNWTRRDGFLHSHSDFRALHGLQSKVIFAYGGNIGVAQDIDNLVRLAMRMRQHPEVHFVMVGRGSEVVRIEKLIASGEAPNVTLLGEVSQNEYMTLLRQCDVGIINLDARLRTHNVPGKLLGYLRAGLPVLASLNRANDLQQLIKASGIGLASVTGEDDALAGNALRLARDEELRIKMGQSTTDALDKYFSVERAARQIVGVGTPVQLPHLVAAD